MTYGTTADCNVRAEAIGHDGGRMRFRARAARGKALDVVLNLPGRHNVLNALAAIAVADELGVADAAILKALAEFRGVGRRFQSYGEVPLDGGGAFTLIDDYGHHPAEMAATLPAARGAFPRTPPGARLPAASLHAHARSLRGLREGAVHGGRACCSRRSMPRARRRSSRPTAARSRARVRVAGKVEPVFVEDIGEMPAAIRRVARDGDVVVTMGAGSIGNVPAQLA